MNTKEMIEAFGQGDHWHYDGWAGRVGGETFPIKPWYSAECFGPGERSVSGPHFDTPEEAEQDARRLLAGDEWNAPYEHARIIRNAPALRISIEKEIA